MAVLLEYVTALLKYFNFLQDILAKKVGGRHGPPEQSMMVFAI